MPVSSYGCPDGDNPVSAPSARQVMGGDGKTLNVGKVAASYRPNGEPSPNPDEMAEDPFHLLFYGSLQNQMAMGFVTLSNTQNECFSTWDIGINHNLTEGHYHD